MRGLVTGLVALLWAATAVGGSPPDRGRVGRRCADAAECRDRLREVRRLRRALRRRQGGPSATAAVAPTPSAFAYTGSLQTYTVPVAGVYRLDVSGGAGGPGDGNYPNGYAGGLGASVSATFRLAKGDVLDVYVGQQGLSGVDPTFQQYGSAGSGGGASAIAYAGATAPLIIAGAGGGAPISPGPRDGIDAQYALGGSVSGSGGSGSADTTQGTGGGGGASFNANGGNDFNYAQGGTALTAGGAGGAPYDGVTGGYEGGGGSGGQGGGGGAGATGGNGGSAYLPSNSGTSGTGGTSAVAGSALTSSSAQATTAADGSATITFVSA